jgi:hypothetical protein
MSTCATKVKRAGTYQTESQHLNSVQLGSRAQVLYFLGNTVALDPTKSNLSRHSMHADIVIVRV